MCFQVKYLLQPQSVKVSDNQVISNWVSAHQWQSIRSINLVLHKVLEVLSIWYFSMKIGNFEIFAIFCSELFHFSAFAFVSPGNFCIFLCEIVVRKWRLLSQMSLLGALVELLNRTVWSRPTSQITNLPIHISRIFCKYFYECWNAEQFAKKEMAISGLF